DKLPGWLPHEQVSLGLDLQGGSHLLLEVDVNSLIHEHLTNVIDSIRADLRKAGIGYTALGIDQQSAVVKLRDPATIEAAQAPLRQIANNNHMTLDIGSDGAVRMTYTDDELRAIKSRAVEQSIEIVRRRVDETGTREPTIQRQGDDRILVQ